jgi:flagellar biosynthetic protein FlhB
MASQPSGEKTEKPTPQRIREAQDQGQIAKSQDLTVAVGLLFFTGAFVLNSPTILSKLIFYLQNAIVKSTQDSMTSYNAAQAISILFLSLFFPIFSLILAILLSGLFQSKGLVTFKTLQLDFTKITPSLNAMFSAHALKEIIKGCFKITLISILFYWTLKSILTGILSLCLSTDQGVLVFLGTVSKTSTFRIAAFLVCLGVADYLWERHIYWKSLRMTHDEVKRESKESEGDPHHKQERQRLHRDLMQQRMLNDVRKAQFVVVNPDHIAIAIQYDQTQGNAPFVIAKGENLLAEKIKAIAREHHIPIFRDVTLARSLRDVEEGDEIPEALYEAVAELLAVIERLPGESKADRPTDVDPPPNAQSHWVRG